MSLCVGVAVASVASAFALPQSVGQGSFPIVPETTSICSPNPTPCEITLDKLLTYDASNKAIIFKSMVQGKNKREPVTIKDQVLVLLQIRERSPVTVGQLMTASRANLNTWQAHLLSQAGAQDAAKLVLAMEYALIGGEVSPHAHTQVAAVSEDVLPSFRSLSPSYQQDVLVAMEKIAPAYAQVLRKKTIKP